jgi:2-dehydro-3-deoxyphosphogluconate aldolase/(4S)-4-hydroxy-2-oxoglutarate aldolase
MTALAVGAAASIQAAGVMGILRGVDAERARSISLQLWSSLNCPVEVPLQSALSRETLLSLVAFSASHRQHVGAGTIVGVRVHAAALECGATFTVAPDTNPEVILAAQKAEVLHIPGVATPTDVRIATDLGCHLLKAFPAASLGPGWIRELSGPFPEVRFIATGGISAINARAFFNAGAVAIGVGTAIEDPALQEIILQRQTHG